MRETATPECSGPVTKTPKDLTPGDVVVIGEVPYEVLARPFVGMAGGSVFDVPELFWRARVRRAGDAERAAGYATWAVGATVRIWEPGTA